MGNLHARGAFLYPVAAHGLQLTNDYCTTLRVARALIKDQIALYFASLYTDFRKPHIRDSLPVGFDFSASGS